MVCSFLSKIVRDMSPAWSNNGLWEMQHLYWDYWSCLFSSVPHRALIPIDGEHGKRVRLGMEAWFIV